jgi:ribosomal protein S18 acetylase RimI-like enzyme
VQLHQRTKADEEFTALKQQQLEQRMGRAGCRFAPLVAVCGAGEVPGIREDLVLPPPETTLCGGTGASAAVSPPAAAASEDSEAALTALLLGLGSGAAPSAVETVSASAPVVEPAGIDGPCSAPAADAEAVVATLDLYNVRALADEVLIGNSSNAAYLANVCVAPQARRRGAGTALLEAARQMARDWGAPSGVPELMTDCFNC